ncbi:MAG: sugar ABC transporter ATP-binding protein, partial [Actinomycetota bacterium]
MRPRLSVAHASKTFGRVTVLHDAALEILPGEIHGLVGQNGSGKSTLIKLLSGFYAPDAGASIAVDGTDLDLPVRPHDLHGVGLSFVHQNLGLDDRANVIENVRIGRFQVGRVSRRIRWSAEAADVSSTLATLGAGDVNPYALVGSLNHGQRASVAIARAIQGIAPGGGCIVFDESTQSLPRDVLHDFYDQVRRLAASGTSVLLVSHRLDEVLALCDRVTVLEDGRVTVSAHPTAGLSEAELGRLILGSSKLAREEASGALRPTVSNAGPVVLEANDLTAKYLDGASLSLHAGEIVGVIGTAESGYDELPYVVSGATRALGGTVEIGGTTVSAAKLTPGRAIALGISLVPGDRAGQGIATGLLALDNLALPRLLSGRGGLFLRREWQLEEFRTTVETLGLTPPDPYLHAGSFSGGNQQKLLLAKWLLNRPKALVLHEPTQAVDVGARADILRALREQADGGTAILISSLETSDLAAVCDRVLVLRDGKVAVELSGAGLDTQSL